MQLLGVRLAGAIAFVCLWKSGWLGLGRASWALLIRILVLAEPAILITKDIAESQLLDILADLEDLPPLLTRMILNPRETLAKITEGVFSRSPIGSQGLELTSASQMVL